MSSFLAIESRSFLMAASGTVALCTARRPSQTNTIGARSSTTTRSEIGGSTRPCQLPAGPSCGSGSTSLPRMRQCGSQRFCVAKASALTPVQRADQTFAPPSHGCIRLGSGGLAGGAARLRPARSPAPRLGPVLGRRTDKPEGSVCLRRPVRMTLGGRVQQKGGASDRLLDRMALPLHGPAACEGSQPAPRVAAASASEKMSESKG